MKHKTIPKRPERRIKKRPPILLLLYYAFTTFCLTSGGMMILSESYAQWFRETIGRGMRRLLAFLTDRIPFSVGELSLMMAPVLLVFFVIWAIIKRKRIRIILKNILCLLCIFVIAFTTTLMPGYHAEALEDTLGLNREAVSKNDLLDTACCLMAMLEETEGEIVYPDDGASLCPLTLDEITDELICSYDLFDETYGTDINFESRVKPVFHSSILTKIGLTGIYSCYTGEANVNVEFPDYTVVFTMAHEMAHQRGIIKEDEANFMAFLICINAENSYIRYCGYLNTLEYILASLKKADTTYYSFALSLLSDGAVLEEKAYSDFYHSHHDEKASEINSQINDAYLKSNGQTAGVQSYNYMTDLVVAYYKQEVNGK